MLPVSGALCDRRLDVDTRPLNVLSICSGYGGIELGLHAALAGRTRTVCYVENELGVASILAARMEDGSLDQAPVWTDLRTFDPEPWRGRVDILAGGFPCQPHSVAGNQLGGDDPRELSGEVLRIADGLGLPDLFLENVPGVLRFYWDSIRPQLREMGYSLAEGLFTASETGAPHKRERLFILAHAECERGQSRELYARDEPEASGRGQTGASRSSGEANVAHAEGSGGSHGIAKTERQGRSPSSGVDNKLAHAGHTERQGRIKGEEGGEGGTCGEPAPQGSELADTYSRGRWENGFARGMGEMDGREANLSISTQERHSRDELADAEEQPQRESDNKATTKCTERQAREITGRRGRRMGGELAHARQQHQQLQRRGIRPESQGEGNELAHAGITGLQGIRSSRQAEHQERPRDVPIYPPGPNDHAGWAYMLNVMPEAQPTFCRDADGAPAGVDRRLRAVGNGVVPAVAALAFTELSRRL